MEVHNIASLVPDPSNYGLKINLVFNRQGLKSSDQEHTAGVAAFGSGNSEKRKVVAGGTLIWNNIVLTVIIIVLT